MMGFLGLLFDFNLALAQTQGNSPIQVAFPQLSFSQPVGLVNSGDNSKRLFIVEQTGTIKVFQNTPNISIATTFLDLTDRVLYGGEQGLLGLAFHPNFAVNGFFYVDYVASNPTRTIVARFSVSTNDANLADKATGLVLLEIPQPFSNHKGGQLAFGPDGYLYIGMGDGGGAGDPFGNGQNRSALLGKILRIDVDSPSQGRNYGIPMDNPLAGNTLGYREELYAWGFRNPWRFSFDSSTGKLWVGDVGQDRIEEIDVVEKGRNYGWNIMEGTQPYAGGSTVGLQPPVYEYDHSFGNAIIGGYVYRGSAMPQLAGSYVYGDYGSGRIWTLAANGTNAQLAASGLSISSFGLDENKELYLCALDGRIYKLDSSVIPEFPVASIFVALVLVATVFTATMKKKL